MQGRLEMTPLRRLRCYSDSYVNHPDRAQVSEARDSGWGAPEQLVSYQKLQNKSWKSTAFRSTPISFLT